MSLIHLKVPFISSRITLKIDAINIVNSKLKKKETKKCCGHFVELMKKKLYKRNKVPINCVHLNGVSLVLLFLKRMIPLKLNAYFSRKKCLENHSLRWSDRVPAFISTHKNHKSPFYSQIIFPMFLLTALNIIEYNFVIIGSSRKKRLLSFSTKISLFICCRFELSFLNWMGLNKYRRGIAMTLIFINGIDFFPFFVCFHSLSIGPIHNNFSLNEATSSNWKVKGLEVPKLNFCVTWIEEREEKNVRLPIFFSSSSSSSTSSSLLPILISVKYLRECEKEFQ